LTEEVLVAAKSWNPGRQRVQDGLYSGFDGVAIDFINFLDELPYFVNEVIRRLERMEIRKPV
jgi:hypothetical protein